MMTITMQMRTTRKRTTLKKGKLKRQRRIIRPIVLSFKNANELLFEVRFPFPC